MLHQTISNDDISATQRSNIVATLFWEVTTWFQHCNPVLGWKSSLRIVACNITSKHKLHPFFCLDHGNRLRRKIMFFFFHVQSFISESKRFYKSTQICMFHLSAFFKYLLIFFLLPLPVWLITIYCISFGFNDISKWALSMSLLLLLGQTFNKICLNRKAYAAQDSLV